MANPVDSAPQDFNSFDWIVFDDDMTIMREHSTNTIETLANFAKSKKVISRGLSYELPFEMKIILEVDKLADYTPSISSTLQMIHMPDSIYSLEEDFRNWKKRLCETQPYFARFSKLLNRLYLKILRPCLNFMEDSKKTNRVIKEYKFASKRIRW